MAGELGNAVVRLRRDLHRNPEPSNAEEATARRVADFLGEHGLSPVRRRLGGHGLLYRVKGTQPGPRRLFRADLDALPIHEMTRIAHRSRRDGVHHACGHDGHMAMLAGAMASLAASADFPGEAWAVFQPAEETGQGAARVLRDMGTKYAFDRTFAIHNDPGTRLGAVLVRPGVAARASVGLEVRIVGRRGHASEPDQAINPLPALARVALDVQDVATIPDRFAGRTLATLVAVSSEGPNFGVSPGSAALYATLRGDRTADVERLVARVLARARRIAARDGATVASERHDPFPHTANAAAAVGDVLRATQAAGLRQEPQEHPLSASEDFGHFTATWPGALVLLGSGVSCAPLHSSRYDFPDSLLPLGVRLWCALAAAGSRV